MRTTWRGDEWAAVCVAVGRWSAAWRWASGSGWRCASSPSRPACPRASRLEDPLEVVAATALVGHTAGADVPRPAAVAAVTAARPWPGLLFGLTVFGVWPAPPRPPGRRWPTPPTRRRRRPRRSRCASPCGVRRSNTSPADRRGFCRNALLITRGSARCCARLAVDSSIGGVSARHGSDPGNGGAGRVVQMRTVYCHIARIAALGGSHPMLRLILALVLGMATALPAAAQSTAINGSIEGVVTDDSGAVLPGVTVTVVNLDTGDTRVVVTNESGLYRAPLLPLGTLPGVGRAAGLQEVRADRHQHLGRPDRRHQREAGRRRAVSETISVTADAPLVDLEQDRAGPHADRGRDQDAAAHLAQPLQLRAAAARRRRLRERGVRRAAPHRQRRAAARQLPDRRQQQHPEGPRRPAPDADVGGDDPRGEGRHHRLRARVRPDDGADLQRDHAVGHQHVQGPGAATASSASRWRPSRSSSRARAPTTPSRRPT